MTSRRSSALSAVVIGLMFVMLGLSGCRTTSEPLSDAPTLSATSPVPRADLRNSGVGNAYDGQPEPYSGGCQKWQGADVFAGCDRRVAKVSLVPESEAPTAVYPSISAFKRELLDGPDYLDTFMRDGVQPRLRRTATHDRHPFERRNVAIDVELIAVKAEPDRDYHLIVGDPGCKQPECFFNVEISGLPLDGHPDRAALAEVREVFEEFIDHTNVGGSYHFWDEPRPKVRIGGSMFYDISHPPGQVGPQGFRPWTAWEIHPVRSIEFWE